MTRCLAAARATHPGDTALTDTQLAKKVTAELWKNFILGYETEIALADRVAQITIEIAGIS